MLDKIIEIIFPIFIAIILLGGLGFLFGLGLAFISRIFHVEIDPRIEKIIEILPGINCGACGYPGCSGYAEALIKEDVDINFCSPGGDEVMDAIGEILGKTADVKEPMVAKIHCIGDDKVSLKDYDFNGEEDCTVIYNFFQGDKSCKYGCVGRGNCIKVCPVNAITKDARNRVVINADKCIGCEKCVDVCPPDVIKMVPKNGGHFVACSNKEIGKLVRKICKTGCIACGICERLAGSDRIPVLNNLAEVKYNTSHSLENAAVKCPSNVIVPIINQQAFLDEVERKEFLKQQKKLQMQQQIKQKNEQNTANGNKEHTQV